MTTDFSDDTPRSRVPAPDVGDADLDTGFALGVEAAHPYLWSAGASDAVGVPSCHAGSTAR